MNLNSHIHLYNSNWSKFKTSSRDFYVCGWTEFKGQIYKEESFAEIISRNKLQSHDSLTNFVSDLNGNFSIIISNNEETFILADRMRMFPVVYFIDNDKLILTDNLGLLLKEDLYKFSFNELALEQYFFSDYVFGPYTIYDNVYSLQSGEIVAIDHSDNTINRKQYFKWEPNMFEDDFERNYQEEAKKQDEIFENVFNRMLRSAPQVNNWIIPLSGGYDSRTIVNYLYKLGVQNVICFSYGIEKNIQSEISQKVAEALNYKWFFIDYNVWINKIKKTKLINNFLLQAFNGTSVAHLQDFIAVYALKEMNLLQKGDIFVPGHALEVLAGNHLNQKMKLCKDTNSSLSIIRKHFSSFAYSDKHRKKVFNHVKDIINNYGVTPKQIAEYFDWQERQTKFIAYSVKVYEFFGYEWRIPEWDLELFKYWRSIGFNYRINRNMFKHVYKEHLSIDLLKDIPFANDILEQNKRSVKMNFFDYLPLDMKRIIKKLFYPKSRYYANEGLHLVYSNYFETISDYLKSFEVPILIKKHLKRYPKRQRISTLPINSVSTLLIIRYFNRL